MCVCVCARCAREERRSAGIADVNHQIAQAALGALWPLDAAEVAGANARIRDMVRLPATLCALCFARPPAALWRASTVLRTARCCWACLSLRGRWARWRRTLASSWWRPTPCPCPRRWARRCALASHASRLDPRPSLIIPCPACAVRCAPGRVVLQGLWQDGFKALNHLMPRSDPVYEQQPVVISSEVSRARLVTLPAIPQSAGPHRALLTSGAHICASCRCVGPGPGLVGRRTDRPVKGAAALAHPLHLGQPRAAAQGRGRRRRHARQPVRAGGGRRRAVRLPGGRRQQRGVPALAQPAGAAGD